LQAINYTLENLMSQAIETTSATRVSSLKQFRKQLVARDLTNESNGKRPKSDAFMAY